MKNSYGFELDLDNYNQVGDTRYFEIQADKEAVRLYIVRNCCYR